MAQRNYRNQLSQEYPAWAHDEETAKRVQAALLSANPNLNLGHTGPHKDGVDGDWGQLSQTAWKDLTDDQQRAILTQAHVAQAAPVTLPPIKAAVTDSPRVAPPQARPSSSYTEIRATAAAAPSDAPSPYQDKINETILRYARATQGTHYSLNNEDGGVNCSTFVYRAVSRASHASREPISALDGTSEQQTCNALGVSENTKLSYFNKKDLLDQQTLIKLQPGMQVSMAFNSLHQDFSRGRTNDISHIGTVVRDEHGRLCIADSSGGVGVDVTPIEQWVEKNNAYDPRGARFYVGQPFVNLAPAPEAPNTPQQIQYAQTGQRKPASAHGVHLQTPS